MSDMKWLKEIKFSQFINVAQKNLWSDFSERKQRIYVKMNWNFEKNHQCVEFVVALLIFQIKYNVSDVHIWAFNNVEWSIKYRRNKVLEFLKYEEIQPILYDVIDYLFEKESDAFKQTKKEFYDTFMNPIWEFRIIYSQDQFFNKVNFEQLSDTEKEIFENTSEMKIKLMFVQKINEAFQVMYKFHDWAKDQEWNITIWYWETIESVEEWSFRIEWKKQDIEIDWKSFYSIVSRKMMTDFFPLSKLWVWSYEPLFREKLLIKKLNIIWWETNSWKSTTILSLLHETYKSLQWKIKIYSIENPIEKPVDFILQTQIRKIMWNNPNENFSFEDFERFALRSDPDWILIWEIRDYNTANIAMKLALSWHFCYATLHIWTALWVVPRFQWWWLDMKNNITSLWFVEITQLVTTFKTENYSKDDKIVKKIKNWMLRISDLKEIPYHYYWEYLEEKKKEKEWYVSEKLNDEIRELFQFIQWRSYLFNIFSYYHTNDKNKLFLIQQYFEKYLKYLSTYFSNRYVDWDEFLWKKEVILDFLKIFNWHFLNDQYIKEKLYQDEKMWIEKIREFYQYIFTTLKKKYLEDKSIEVVLKFLQDKNNMKVIMQFLSWTYTNNSWHRIPFFFTDFFDLIWEKWYIPFKTKTSWVVPVIEIFDYTEDYKLVLEKDEYKLFYWTKSFTPMFLYWFLNINQQILDQWKTIDFFNIISMFSSEYELN